MGVVHSDTCSDVYESVDWRNTDKSQYANNTLICHKMSVNGPAVKAADLFDCICDVLKGKERILMNYYYY